jgi:hypothetical protein
MVKPRLSPDVLATLATAIAKERKIAPHKEAKPIAGKTERETIRPARTAIAHARGGNKGK